MSSSYAARIGATSVSGSTLRRRPSSATTRSAVVGSLRPAASGPRYGESVSTRKAPSARAAAAARGPARRAERDREREADDEARVDEAPRHLRVAAEGVKHATTAPREQRRLGRVVRLAVVDEHRQVAGAGERELAREGLSLHLRGRQVAVEVEADLPDRSRAAVGDQ